MNKEHQTDIERGVLAHLLSFPEIVGRAVTEISPEDFGSPKNRAIFNGIAKCYKNDEPINPLSLSIAVDSGFDVKMSELQEIQDTLSISSEYFPHLYKDLKEESTHRRLIEWLSQSINALRDPNREKEGIPEDILEGVKHIIDSGFIGKNQIILPSMEDVFSMDIKVEWALDKLIPMNAVSVLHGVGGIKKTWLMLQIGGCIADGVNFCGYPVIRQPVIYCDFENSLPTLHDRAIILGKSSMQVWHLSNKFPPPRLDTDEWIRYKDLPLGLLIFDSLRSSQLLDENSSQDMAIIMSRLKELREMGFTVVLIHHSPKADKRTYKGSSAIQDLCDHVLSLDPIEEDDSFDGIYNVPLRFGVRGKTRFEAHSITIKFEPESGFILAPDPDEEAMEMITDAIASIKKGTGESPNQTQIAAFLKEEGLTRKRVRSYLKKGLNKLWIESRVGGSSGKKYDLK